MRGIGGSTLRGGQTVFHGLRMWGQLFKAAIMLAAFMAVAVPAWNLWRGTSGYDWYAAGMYTLAEVKLAFGYDPASGQEVRAPDGAVQVLTIREIAASAPARRIRERIKTEMFASAWLGIEAGLAIIALFLAWFWYRGMQLGRRRRRSICARSARCPEPDVSGPTASPASPTPSAPRPSTPSSRAPRARARRC